MVKKIELQERNAANDGWEEVYTKTSSDLVLDEATGKTVKVRLEETDSSISGLTGSIESLETDKLNKSEKGQPSGVGSLDGEGHIPIPQLGKASKIATGTYSGNGATSRIINVGFSPDFVYITGEATDNVGRQWFLTTINSVTTSQTQHMASGFGAELDLNGIKITSSEPNASGKTYAWVALGGFGS